MNRHEEIAAKYGECLKAVDVLRCIPAIDCDKLTKEIVYTLIEEVQRGDTQGYEGVGAVPQEGNSQ